MLTVKKVQYEINRYFCGKNVATHIFFHKNSSIYAIFNDQSFNNTLTNDVSFEQLGLDIFFEDSTYL